jgi:hypothetical protein
VVSVPGFHGTVGDRCGSPKRSSSIRSRSSTCGQGRGKLSQLDEIVRLCPTGTDLPRHLRIGAAQPSEMSLPQVGCRPTRRVWLRNATLNTHGDRRVLLGSAGLKMCVFSPGTFRPGCAVLGVAGVETPLRWSSRHRYPERTASAGCPPARRDVVVLCPSTISGSAVGYPMWRIRSLLLSAT